MAVSMTDVKKAFKSAERGTLKACRMLAEWFDEPLRWYKDSNNEWQTETVDSPASYAARVMGVTQGTITKYRQAGLVLFELEESTTDLTLLTTLTARSVRPLTELLDSPAELAAAITDSIEAVPEGGTLSAQIIEDSVEGYRPEPTPRDPFQQISADIKHARQKAFELGSPGDELTNALDTCLGLIPTLRVRVEGSNTMVMS